MQLKLYKLLFLALILTQIICYNDVVEIEITEPKDLRKMQFAEGSFTLANYGQVPYGKTIVGKVQLSNPETACTSLIEEENQTYPILLIKRGDCKFVEKTYQAQLVNTKLVIIYDTVEEDENQIIMVGEQDLVRIPTIMVKKNLGDKLVDAVQNSNLVIQVHFKSIQQKQQTLIDFWLDSSDEDSLKFFNFLTTNQQWSELLKSKNVAFRPRYAIWYCGKCSDSNYSITDNIKCISQGRYCHPDPDENIFVNGPLQGKDAVFESLRQICIFNEYGYTDNPNLVGSKWIFYMKKYLNKCIEEPRQNNYHNLNSDYLEKCSYDIMKKVGIEKKKVEKCIDNSYFDSKSKTTSNNSLLIAEQSQFVTEGIQVWPSLFINNVTYKGDLFSNISALSVCQSLTQESRPSFCPGSKNPAVVSNKGLTTISVVLIIILISIVLMAVGFIFYRRMLKRDMQAEMQLQVNSAISQYFALQEQKSKK